MPTLPPIVAQPYDTVNDVLNVCRTRLNGELKTLLPVGGALLDNNQVFMNKVVNHAWRRSQECLANKGYSRLIDETIISSIPVVSSVDPASQCWLSWQGFFDGNNLFQQPALPPGFSHPLKLWERWSGQNAQFGDPPMEKFLDGIPAVSKTTAHRFWEWRQDAIYTPGSQMVEDFRIRHVSFMQDLLDVGATPWFQQPVPIPRISDGLSWFIIAELIVARGQDATPFEERAESALGRTMNLDVKADQRVNIRRQPRSGRAFGRSWY